MPPTAVRYYRGICNALMVSLISVMDWQERERVDALQRIQDGDREMDARDIAFLFRMQRRYWGTIIFQPGEPETISEELRET